MVDAAWYVKNRDECLEAAEGLEHSLGRCRCVEVFRRENKGNVSIDIWQRYASPVWMDINQTNTLNARMGRDNNDERHVCPLQLDVIERCLQLWSNPGDVVLSPFAGIGSEGVGSLRAGRKFVGIELKKSYFDAACKFLAAEEREQSIPTLFEVDA